jgi:uncharacterized protein (TIGR03437 family)
VTSLASLHAFTASVGEIVQYQRTMSPVIALVLLATGVSRAADDATVAVSGVVNAANNLAGPIAPGELVAMTGLGLGAAQHVSARGTDGLYLNELAETTVQINSMPALLLYTSTSQVAAVVPELVPGRHSASTVTYQGKTPRPARFRSHTPRQGFLLKTRRGRGHAATINQKDIANIPAHWEGDVIMRFVTGIGSSTALVTIDGCNLPVTPVSVTKGTVPGVMEIKVRIPYGQNCDTKFLIRAGDARASRMSPLLLTSAFDCCGRSHPQANRDRFACMASDKHKQHAKTAPRVMEERCAASVHALLLWQSIVQVPGSQL